MIIMVVVPMILLQRLLLNHRRLASGDSRQHHSQCQSSHPSRRSGHRRSPNKAIPVCSFF
jgi:hypothetical protein